MSQYRETNEQISDPIDQASRTEQQMNDAALSNQRAKSKPEQVKDADGRWPITQCVDCEDPLGDRMHMGRIRCFYCQTDVERLNARRGNSL
jgi:RNA polymerase-binding transcription factor DksA